MGGYVGIMEKNMGTTICKPSECNLAKRALCCLSNAECNGTRQVAKEI